jgi:hypothetical protein
MRIVSIGDQVQPGRYALHSRFRRALNFTDGRRLVSLVSEEVGPGPLNLVVPGSAPPPREQLVLRRQDLGPDRARVYDSSLHLARCNRRRFRRNLAALEATLVAESHPLSLAFLLDRRRLARFTNPLERALAKRVRTGVGAIRAGLAKTPRAARATSAAVAHACASTARGVRTLAGCGFGLTPSGDDFIAGVLVALCVVEQSRAGRVGRRAEAGPRPRGGASGRVVGRLKNAVLGAGRSGSILAASAIEMAARGRVPARTQRLVAALAGGDRDEVVSAARAVLAMGSTSGADFATGLLLALRWGARWVG